MADPDFATVTAELTAVLLKHDTAAVFILAKPPKGTVAYHFEATWSCASIDGHNFGLALDEPDRLQDTLAMLCAFDQTLTGAQQDIQGMLELVGRHVAFAGRATLVDPEPQGPAL